MWGAEYGVTLVVCQPFSASGGKLFRQNIFLPSSPPFHGNRGEMIRKTEERELEPSKAGSAIAERPKTSQAPHINQTWSDSDSAKEALVEPWDLRPVAIAHFWSALTCHRFSPSRPVATPAGDASPATKRRQAGALQTVISSDRPTIRWTIVSRFSFVDGAGEGKCPSGMALRSFVAFATICGAVFAHESFQALVARASRRWGAF